MQRVLLAAQSEGLSVSHLNQPVEIAVTAPAGLSVFGIIPCARKAVADHVFPTYDGPAMTVRYNIEIGGAE